MFIGVVANLISKEPKKKEIFKKTNLHLNFLKYINFSINFYIYLLKYKQSFFRKNLLSFFLHNLKINFLFFM